VFPVCHYFSSRDQFQRAPCICWRSELVIIDDIGLRDVYADKAVKIRDHSTKSIIVIIIIIIINFYFAQ